MAGSRKIHCRQEHNSFYTLVCFSGYALLLMLHTTSNVKLRPLAELPGWLCTVSQCAFIDPTFRTLLSATCQRGPRRHDCWNYQHQVPLITLSVYVRTASVLTLAPKRSVHFRTEWNQVRLCLLSVGHWASSAQPRGGRHHFDHGGAGSDGAQKLKISLFR